jgi:hypothetical protein
MSTPAHWPKGRHAPNKPVLYWDADCSIEHPANVVLTGSIEDDSIQDDSDLAALPSLRRETATTLELQMGPRAAKELYEKLGELGRSMGWLPIK